MDPSLAMRDKLDRDSLSNDMGASDGQSSKYTENTALKVDQLRQKTKTPAFVYVLTFSSAIGGFLFGYDTGVISGAMILLREVFILNYVWQELVVSVTIGAAAVFAIFGGFLNDFFGRKPVILLASVIFTAGSICMGIANNKELLLLGRLIVGAGIGLTSMTVPMYIAECAPLNIRGRLVSVNVAMIAGGQFIANVVDGIFSFDITGWRWVMAIIVLGLASMTVPIYIAECAPTTSRGRLVMIFQIMITFGQFIASLLDGFLAYVEDGWRYMLGLAAAPSFIQFMIFIFMPESPRWLIVKGKEDMARLVLQRIRGEADIEEEFYAIKQNCIEVEEAQKVRRGSPIIWQMLMIPSTRRALIIGCSLQMIQQVVGINTVMYYSATIIKMSGVKSPETAIWLSALTAFVNFIFTFVGLYLVERIGRRPLTISSLIGAIISLAWLAIGFNLAAVHSSPVTVTEDVNKTTCLSYRTCNSCMMDQYCGYCYVDTSTGPVNGSCLPTAYEYPSTATSGRCSPSMHETTNLYWAYDYCPTQYAWMCMVGLVLYLAFFAPGMGPMPWTINSEIYPIWARSTGNAAATAVNWIFNLAVSMSFLTLTETLTRYGTFWLYACLATLGAIFLALFLPETKGKSLEEVEGLFAQPWCGGSTSQPVLPYDDKSVQYVHIRGLNRDGRESELDSPDDT